MKNFILTIDRIVLKSMIILFTWFTFLPYELRSQHDHEGHHHDHESTAGANAEQDLPMQSKTEANTLRYEAFLKFTPTEPGEELIMKLFVSDVNTNRPIDSAKIQMINLKANDQTFEISQQEKGIYNIRSTMPAEDLFDLQIQVATIDTNETILLKDVDFTHRHSSSVVPHVHESNALLYSAVALLILVIGFIIGKMTTSGKMRKNMAGLLLLFISLPLVQNKTAFAHEEEHSEDKKTKLHSAHFEVQKESQFLMNILTRRVETGQFSSSRKLYGTVIPSSKGQGFVISPQAGRIENLQVSVGQRVSKGEQLAVLKRISNASDEVNYEAEKNRLESEYVIAKKEVDRIKSLEGIASRKQLEEAQSRFDVASANRELYSSGTGNKIILKAPISGVVGSFQLSEGSSVNAEQILFTITDIQEVYIEAQAYEKDLEVIETSNRFLVHCMEDNHSTTNVKLLSLGQEFNSSNQSQRVIFAAENSENEFKLGEFVNVFAFSNASASTIALPNSAITELEGRPIAFVKNSAEEFEIRYIATGHDNGIETVIESGIHIGDRVVVEGAYQVKLIYMNK